MILVVVSCPNPPTSTVSALPEEFTLQLGPHSSTQVAAMARLLKEMGAKVAIDPQGGLVAQRPGA